MQLKITDSAAYDIERKCGTVLWASGTNSYGMRRKRFCHKLLLLTMVAFLLKQKFWGDVSDSVESETVGKIKIMDKNIRTTGRDKCRRRAQDLLSGE